jgi:hypothetical protein
VLRIVRKVVLARLPTLRNTLQRLGQPPLAGYVLWVDMLTAPAVVDVLPIAAVFDRLDKHNNGISSSASAPIVPELQPYYLAPREVVLGVMDRRAAAAATGAQRDPASDECVAHVPAVVLYKCHAVWCPDVLTQAALLG